MNLANLHMLLNHLPILGTLITLGVFVVALIGNKDDLKQASLTLFAFLALAAIPAYLSGPGAQAAIQESADVSMTMIEAHQGAALLAFIFMELTGAAAILSLWRFSGTGKWVTASARTSLSVVLVFALLTAGLMGIAGNTGGDIRHPEILAGQEPASAIGAMGASLIKSIEVFVIDTSQWIWPILEDLHFIGLILLLGTIGVLNLRVLGFMKRLPIAPLHRFIPWGIAGFIINVITGFLFYLGMPGFYVLNFVFQLKILAVLIAGATLLLFYCTSAFRGIEQVGPGEDAAASAKLVAACSLLLWLAVIILGRYIPFGEVT